MEEKSSKPKQKHTAFDEGDPLSFKELLQVRNSEAALILLVIPFILTFWVYYGKQADFVLLFKGFHK